MEEIKMLPLPQISEDEFRDMDEMLREFSRAFCIPPKVLYHGQRPCLIVDNTKKP